MERPKCKLCSKTFSNGKALGGHMKAHFAALPIPNKTRSQLSDRTESAPSSSSDDRIEPRRRQQQQHEHEEEEDSSRVQGYVLRSNPKKSFVLADPSCHRFDAVSSGAESPPPQRSRPARRRRSSKRKLVSAESTPLSSVTDSFSPEEDVALCLMMLSRDTGGESARPGQASRAAQFKCGTCGKVFKSHQALGGHVASHKRAAKNKNSSENGVVAARPMLLDLNMPAPVDDNDDDQYVYDRDDDNDQLDLSAVSQIQS